VVAFSERQVELHPYAPQLALQAYCAAEGIALQAYASLGGQDAGKGALTKLGGALLVRAEVLAIAAKHGGPASGATPAAVLLKWALQQDIAVIPKSSQPARMRENLAACSADAAWDLDSADMAALGALDQSESEESRLCWKSDPLKQLDFD
jgi:alcohol dehydrogenase (NADP+)